MARKPVRRSKALVATAAPPLAVAELTRPIATTADGRDITRPWVGELHEARDPRLWQSVDWGVYDRILADDQVFSTFQQRRMAVVSRPWDVLPGGEAAADKEAAARLKDELEQLGWDRVTEKMLFARFNGYAVAETMWRPTPGGIALDDIRVRHARRFRLDRDERLRLLTIANMRGEIMPERKFWMVTAGAADDDEPYGHGLAELLYWPTLFKRNGVKFWNTFLDKFGAPTAVGKYRPGTPQADIDKLLATLQAISTDSGIAIPEGMLVELLQATRSGTGDFATLCGYMDGAIAKIVLSQVGTTENGKWAGTGDVHAGVKLELVKADADLLSDSFNAGPAEWWTALNYGDRAKPPRVVRIVEEEADLKAAAETDEALGRLGWERTEESFKDTYGDGYVRKVAPPPPVEVRPLLPAPANDHEAAAAAKTARVAAFAAGDPKPLYVCRKVENGAAILAWARGQGLKPTIAEDDLHVTVAYSRRPLDWLAIGAGWGSEDGRLVIPAGGARIIDRFDAKGPIVLLFSSNELRWRHDEIREAGASWDYPSYRPHITLAYDGEGVDLSKVEPFRGIIRLGPEIFTELQDDWQGESASFADMPAEADAVDLAVADILADEGWRALAAPMVGPLRAALDTATNFEEALAALIPAIVEMDPDALGRSLAKAGFHQRLGAELDADGALDG